MEIDEDKNELEESYETSKFVTLYHVKTLTITYILGLSQISKNYFIIRLIKLLKVLVVLASIEFIIPELLVNQICH